MFCTNCGKKVPDGSKFCPACGTLLYGEEEQTTVKEHTPIADPSPRPESEPKIKLTKEDQAAVAPSGSIEEVIGKNTAYYLSEFKKVDEGQKPRFNWAAFFLGLFFCFYRKCGDLFKKYFLIPVVIVIAALTVVTIGFTSFSLPIMAVGGILSAIGSIWALVSYIRFGKNFNRDYYEHGKAVLLTGNKKKYGTSIGSALIVVVAVTFLSMVPYIVSLISLSGASKDLDDYESINSTLDGDNGSLNGEYVIVEDATSNEYIFLNFNHNGPGTLQISSNIEPTEIIEATYSIVPTDEIMEGIDSYTLLISNDYLGEEAEFLDFCIFSDDIYYIVFSESWIGAKGETATMVPRTEEYGFGQNTTDINADNIWPNDYSGYNLYNYQNTYVSSNGYELELIVLPSDTEFHANLNWNNSESEGGVVYPGVPSQLDGGSTVVLNLNEDGSIHVVLNDIISETLTTNANNSIVSNGGTFSSSKPSQSTLKAEQEKLYSAMNQQIKELNWYEDDYTGSFLDEYDDIYIEIIAFCDDYGSESYYLNYWVEEVQLECIPANYYLSDDNSLFFVLDDYFSDYKGSVEVIWNGDEYLLCSEIDNCQDTGGYYSLLEKIS